MKETVCAFLYLLCTIMAVSWAENVSGTSDAVLQTTDVGGDKQTSREKYLGHVLEYVLFLQHMATKQLEASRGRHEELEEIVNGLQKLRYLLQQVDLKHIPSEEEGMSVNEGELLIALERQIYLLREPMMNNLVHGGLSWDTLVERVADLFVGHQSEPPCTR